MFRRSYYSKFSFYNRLLQIIFSPNRNEIFLVFRIGYFCSSFYFRKQEYNHVFNDDASLDEDKSDVSKKQRISISSHSPAGDDLNGGFKWKFDRARFFEHQQQGNLPRSNYTRSLFNLKSARFTFTPTTR